MADVPNVPGVPALPSFAPGGSGILLTQDTVTGYGPGLTPVWGLYRGGRPVVTAETVIGFNHAEEWAISNYPIEDGGFESYDRVDTPFRCGIQFVAGKSEQARRALITSLKAATADGNLTKYDVVTPEIVYSGVNVQHIDYARKAQSGLGLLTVSVWVQEIREQNTGGSTSKSSSGEVPQSDGNVQPTDVPLPPPRPAGASQPDLIVT